MDLSKASYTFSHNRLLCKLENNVIRGDAVNWVKAFLENGQQCVVVDSERSDFVAVLSGVPQGSVIGPVLFLTCINDFPQNIRSKVRLSADDFILYLTITSEDHCRQLQVDLDALQKWEATWRMEFNDTKCEVLRISRYKTPIQHTY